MHKVNFDESSLNSPTLNSQELTPPQTLGLTEAESDLVLTKYAQAYKGKPHLPHHTISADTVSGKLKLDLSSAAIQFEWDMDELVNLYTVNKFKGHFVGTQLWDYVGNKQINGQSAILPVVEPIESIDAVFLMYQVDENGNPIDDANDIEIVVSWDKSITRTDDYQLIEALFERLPAKDFTLEELEQRLAEIY